MRKWTICVVLFLTSLSVWADPLVLHRIPPDCQVSEVNGERIIYDSRGFFVGYYRPARPAAKPWIPRVRPADTPRPNLPFGKGNFDAYDSWADQPLSDDCPSTSGFCPTETGTSNPYSGSMGSPLSSPAHGF